MTLDKFRKIEVQDRLAEAYRLVVREADEEGTGANLFR